MDLLESQKRASTSRPKCLRFGRVGNTCTSLCALQKHTTGAAQKASLYNISGEVGSITHWLPSGSAPQPCRLGQAQLQTPVGMLASKDLTFEAALAGLNCSRVNLPPQVPQPHCTCGGGKGLKEF